MKTKSSMRFVTDLSKGILGAPDSSELWTEITSHIPDEILLCPNVKILNVACGHGTEADILVKRMYALGKSPEEAQDSIYVLDKYHVFTNQLMRKGYKHVITADFLTWEPDMEFDVIVGNPPYQKENDLGGKQPSSHNLWNLFAFKAISLLKKDGLLGFVTPDSWMSPSSKILKEMKKHQMVSIKTDVSSYFSGVGSSFSYWILKNDEEKEPVEVDGIKVTFSNVPYFPRNFGKSFGIHEKVIRSNDKICAVFSTKNHSSKNYGNLSDILSLEFPYKIFHTNAQTKYGKYLPDHYDDIKVVWSMSGYFKPFLSITSLGTTEASGYILAKSEEEGKNILSVLNSKLFRFILDTGKWSGFVNGDVLHSLPKVDFTRTWTDEELYAHFELTPEEIEYIEKNA